jgi:N-acetylglucosaminyldiphosphoundecaprenol N-acetyl-beta-D-mannosaminyltransferase
MTDHGVQLFGFTFSTLDAPAALCLAQANQEAGARLAVTINVDHVVTLSQDAEFRDAYKKAVLRTLDGMPLVLLARLRGARGARRVTGHDLLAALLERDPTPLDRIFAVAARPDVAQAIESRFTARGWPADAIRSTVPAFGFQADAIESERLAQAIRAHATTWLLMGVGAPKSEKWVIRMAAVLGSPVALCVGDALNVAAGYGVRAPAVLQATGLEWAWRFAGSPSRLFRRYFIRSLAFPLLALRNPDFSAEKGNGRPTGPAALH